MDPKTLHAELADAARRFNAELIDTHGGRDPVAALYARRRAGYGLFSVGLSDADCEALRPYLFGRPIPRTPADAPVPCLNLFEGVWQRPAEMVPMASLADRRITLFDVARSRQAEVDMVLEKAFAFWTSLEWANEGLAYRKFVVKNFSRLLQYFYEECLDEIRQQIPKTRLEADKDFWEAKRAADHLEGNAEKAMAGDVIPAMLPGQAYWKDSYLPAGVAAVITPMNFVYGIPGIQIIGCYLSGSPMIFKGHPFAGITNTTLTRMMLAAGADPRAIHKLEGFGGDIARLTSDPRVAVVSVTGSAETAKNLQAGRGVRPVKFEGGGCNWAFVDDGYGEARVRVAQVHVAPRRHGVRGDARPARAAPREGALGVRGERPAPRRPGRDEGREPADGAQGQDARRDPGGGEGSGGQGAARRGASDWGRVRHARRGGASGHARPRDAGDEGEGRLGRQGGDRDPPSSSCRSS
jgi:hypothetical protein